MVLLRDEKTRPMPLACYRSAFDEIQGPDAYTTRELGAWQMTL